MSNASFDKVKTKLIIVINPIKEDVM